MGLVNLGATCYMATAVKQLFMLPAIMEGVLQYDDMSLSNTESGFGKSQQGLVTLTSYQSEQLIRTFTVIVFVIHSMVTDNT